MNLVYYFACAAVVGWLITDFVHNRANLYFNLLLALIGAYLAGFFAAPFLGLPNIFSPFNLKTLSIILLGTFILVLPFNLSTKNKDN